MTDQYEPFAPLSCPVRYPPAPELRARLDPVIGQYLREKAAFERRMLEAVRRQFQDMVDRGRVHVEPSEWAGRILPDPPPEEFTSDRLDALSHAAGQLAVRYGPEGLAMTRAARGAHPYQQRRKAHGCEHPCAQCADSPPGLHYVYDEGEAWVLPGEATVDLERGGPPIKARGIRIVPIREIATTEGEGS